MSNPVTDVLAPKTRKYAYALAFVGSTVAAVYTASNGDWVVFTTSLLTAATSILAGSNVQK